jgi:hypothetical protein
MALPAHAPPSVLAEEYFIYKIDFAGAPIGPLTRKQIGFIQLENDADFLLQKLAYFIDIVPLFGQTFGSQPYPLIKVLIIDTGSGRQLSNIPIPITTYFGDGRLPYILPTPKLYTKATRIRIEIENFGVQAYSLFNLELQGKKIFTTG